MLIAAGTVVGLAGTDLVLPAVPTLPDTLNGTTEQAQWVLAAFAAGTGIGLLVYGELGARFAISRVLVLSLVAYAALSMLATLPQTIIELSLIRFVQGLVAAGPAVFAPVMIRSLYAEHAAIAMLGRIGAIESAAPAFAPIAGAWLLGLYGWQSSFYATAAIALCLALIWLSLPNVRQHFGVARRTQAGYWVLLRSSLFMRHALSQAGTLGALLVIVFGAPSVITLSMGGSLSDFIIMQIIGIALFMLSANFVHIWVSRFGAEPVILTGSILTACGCLSLLLMSIVRPNDMLLLWGLFAVVNLGLGLRGPPGFYQALLAAGDNDARGSALVVLFVMLTTASGTAITAPFIQHGLVALGSMASLLSLASVALLLTRRTR